MAILGAFTGGLTGGAVGSAVVRLALDTSEFDAGLARAQGSLTGAAAKMDAIGRRTSAIGGGLTRGLTVPLVAAGAAATKMALDFNSAFVKIQTLGGKTGQSIAQLKQGVLQLAEATGQDPTGLANALYQVTSAGKVAASQAMPILTQAAKGAALGMGDVNDIAHLLTSTMNAYGPKVLSASTAMDVLTQATHDSSAEADALAGSLGPVIGVAAQVGVSFQEVTAALATATNQGISAERAATGLRFLLQSLAAPTQIAKDKLDQYGISAQDLQRMLSNEGLQGTLQDLAGTFDLTSTRGQEAWRAVVGGARGAVIANTQVGNSAKAASDEVTSLGDAAGVTNEKFKIWGETVTGKNARALASLKTAAIRLGEDLIPIFSKLVHVLQGWLDKFNSLSPEMRENIVKWGLIAAALGPVLKLVGTGITLYSRLAGALTSTAEAEAAVAANASGAAGAAGAAGTGAAVSGTALLPAAGVGVAPVVGQGLTSTRGSGVQLQDLAMANEMIELYRSHLDGMNSTQAEAAQTAAELNKQYTAQGSTFRINSAALRVATNQNIGYAAALAEVQGRAGPATRAISDAAFAATKQGKALSDTDTLIARTTQLTIHQKGALLALTGQLAAEHQGLSDNKAQAIAAAVATGHFARAQDLLANALKKGGDAGHHNADGSRDAAKGAKSAADAAELQRNRVESLTSSINKIPKQWQTKISADTSQAKAAVQDFLNYVNNSSARVDVTGVVVGYTRQK